MTKRCAFNDIVAIGNDGLIKVLTGESQESRAKLNVLIKKVQRLWMMNVIQQGRFCHYSKRATSIFGQKLKNKYFYFSYYTENEYSQGV